MKNGLLSIILLVTVCNVVSGQNIPKKWKLIWSEEFNYTGLPDSAIWGYEEGFVRNNESQYYTVARKQNAWVENGMLTITGRKEQYPGKDSLAGYTSAALRTFDKKHFKYGRIEVRAKIPSGPGVWPAIWMLGTEKDWPDGGEIDIMEFVGHDSNHIYGTMHYADTTVKRGHEQDGANIKILQPYNAFHIYAIEWNKNEINCFFDDTMYHHFNINKATYKGDNPFRKPFYLLLNLAIGGSWGGKIDDANLPQKYLVDYVRVYE